MADEKPSHLRLVAAGSPRDEDDLPLTLDERYWRRRRHVYQLARWFEELDDACLDPEDYQHGVQMMQLSRQDIHELILFFGCEIRAVERNNMRMMRLLQKLEPPEKIWSG